jgi:ATP-dependent DNA ligase
LARSLRCLAVRYHEQQPTFIPPMLLTTSALPSGDAWAFEVKWDGCRAQLRYDGRSVSLRTRNGRECAADFPELAEIAAALGKRRGTLDGELVCLRPDGRPDFGQLRHRLTGSTTRRRPVMLQAFDLLHLDGSSTRVLPYVERRSLLEELALDVPAWRTPASVVVERTEDFVARVEELGLEGVVAKRLSSTYLPGRRCRRGSSGRSAVRSGSLSPGSAETETDTSTRSSSASTAHATKSMAHSPAPSNSASLHGLADGPVRDAVLCEVLDA